MKLSRTMGGAAVLFGVAATLGAPANAAPAPGDPCGQGGQVNGNLMCSGQALIWINTDAPHMPMPGTPCLQPGAVTYGRGEDLVTCRSGTWVPWKR